MLKKSVNFKRTLHWIQGKIHSKIKTPLNSEENFIFLIDPFNRPRIFQKHIDPEDPQNKYFIKEWYYKPGTPIEGLLFKRIAKDIAMRDLLSGYYRYMIKNPTIKQINNTMEAVHISNKSYFIELFTKKADELRT